jgi:hypothetical protein
MKIQKNFFIENMKGRAKKISVHVAKLHISIKSEPSATGFYKLLIKNATFIGINYRAATIARSIPEFSNKIHMTIEKADATIFLVDVLLELKSLQNNVGLIDIKKQAKEIIKILMKTKSSAVNSGKNI